MAQTPKVNFKQHSESDVVPSQSLPLPNAGGEKIVPQLKAGGDHNIPNHQMATVNMANLVLVVNKFTMSPWQIIPDEKYSMVDQTLQPGIEAQNRQRALAGAPVDTPSVCQLPGDPSLKIDRQTPEAVSLYSALCSSI
jgi:hypothetical protein